MLLSTCFKRKVVATCGAALGFALLHEAKVFDSHSPAGETEIVGASTPALPGAALRFSATAYCKGEVTAAGTPARSGIVAADPALLPVGSVVKVDDLGSRYNGIYTVMDTGPAVRGRELDLYIWSCQEALAFGRRPARLTVLRLGWNPRASSAAAVRGLQAPPGESHLAARSRTPAERLAASATLVPSVSAETRSPERASQ